MHSILLALGMAGDSGVVSLGLAPLLRNRNSRLMVAWAFGAADSLAVLLGASVGQWPAPGGADAALLALYAALVAAASISIGRWSVWALLPLPLVLALDNAAVGALLRPGEVIPLALLSLCVTPAVALLGMEAGARLPWRGNRWAVAAGLALCTSAAVVLP